MPTFVPRSVLALGIAVLAACSTAGGGDGGSTGGATVTLVDFAIEAPATVPSGTSLTVVNDGEVAHTFTAEESGDFDTGTIEAGGESSVTVEGSGTVSYVCTLHPDRMRGSFDVTDG